MFLHYLWIGPLQAIFVLCYLWYLLGIASLASFIILISLIPVQGSMGRLFTKLRYIQTTISSILQLILNTLLLLQIL